MTPATPSAPRPLFRYVVDAGAGVGLLLALGAVFVLDAAAPVIAPPDLAPAAPAAFDIPPLPDLPEPDLLVSAQVDLPLPPPPAPPQTTPPAPPAPPPQAKPRLIDPKLRLKLGFDTGNMTFGLVTQPDAGDRLQRLTLNEYGHTSHTLVAVDNGFVPFFDRRRGEVLKELTSVGRSEADNSDKTGQGGKTPLDVLADHGPYTVKWRTGEVEFEQSIDYVPGVTSRRMDTARVSFEVKNGGGRARKAGVRLMIDTFIGGNDGVPFFVPGRQSIVDKPLELTKDQVPEYVLALEKPDLADRRMTIVQLGFGSPRDGRPDRLGLTQWPGDKAVAKRFPGEQFRAVAPLERAWTWPLRSSFENDSAVALCYGPRTLEPDEVWKFSFTYGLGSLSSGQSNNATLSLYAPGPFPAGKTFGLSAFVKGARDGQKVTVKLPTGLSLAPGEAAEKVVTTQPGVDLAKVDWVVAIDPAYGGKAEVIATLDGTAATEKYVIEVDNPRPAIREVLVSDRPQPGGKVRLTAQVVNAKAGMMATLALPAGLTLAGQPAELAVAVSGTVGQASWVADVGPATVGDVAVRVTLAPGGVEGRATVPVRAAAAAIHRIVVGGEPTAGAAFRVTAQVLNVAAGQSARLDLPDGLTLAPGEAAEKPLAAGAVAQPSWVVRADRTALGDRTLTVKMSPTGPEKTQTVLLKAGVPALVVHLAREEAVTPGKPFWVVADVRNGPPGGTAELALPAGFTLARGHEARKPLDDKGVVARAAWPVVMDTLPGPTAVLRVSIPGLDPGTVTIQCKAGTLLGQ